MPYTVFPVCNKSPGRETGLLSSCPAPCGERGCGGASLWAECPTRNHHPPSLLLQLLLSNIWPTCARRGSLSLPLPLPLSLSLPPPFSISLSLFLLPSLTLRRGGQIFAVTLLISRQTAGQQCYRCSRTILTTQEGTLPLLYQGQGSLYSIRGQGSLYSIRGQSGLHLHIPQNTSCISGSLHPLPFKQSVPPAVRLRMKNARSPGCRSKTAGDAAGRRAGGEAWLGRALEWAPLGPKPDDPEVWGRCRHQRRETRRP